MGTVVSEPPRYRWPLVLMIAAAVVSLILIGLLMWQLPEPPLGQTPSR